MTGNITNLWYSIIISLIRSIKPYQENIKAEIRCESMELGNEKKKNTKNSLKEIKGKLTTLKNWL